MLVHVFELKHLFTSFHVTLAFSCAFELLLEFLRLEPVTELVDSLLLDLCALLDLPVVCLSIPEVALEFTVVEGTLIHQLHALLCVQAAHELDFADARWVVGKEVNLVDWADL